MIKAIETRYKAYQLATDAARSARFEHGQSGGAA